MKKKEKEKEVGDEDRFGYETFLSPFTWRYGSAEMRRTFSEQSRRAAWRNVWVELARAESTAGLLERADLEDIIAAQGSIDIGAAHELEREIRHDLMAELRVFAAQAKKGGGKLHLGATSMDIEDNADAATFGRGVDIILERLFECLKVARQQIVRYKGMVCMAWTHLQPAEPTTLGYRFANYALDLLIDIEQLQAVRDGVLKGKGLKGAVGTSASFTQLLDGKSGTMSARQLESDVMNALGLECFPVSTQTYPRKVDFILLSSLASIAASCHKFGLDVRVLQSPAFGELSEPFEESQVGSSAMPFKRNPVRSERMCSLARLVSVYPQVAFSNASQSILERTLDDSANRRVIIPEAFLAIEECLMLYARLMRGLQVYPAMVARNLDRFGPFSGTEAIMMRLVEMGGDRQVIHERLRVDSLSAWAEVMKDKPNPLAEILADDPSISSKLSTEEIARLLDPMHHTGDAEERSERLVNEVIDPILAGHSMASTKSKNGNANRGRNVPGKGGMKHVVGGGKNVETSTANVKRAERVRRGREAARRARAEDRVEY